MDLPFISAPSIKPCQTKEAASFMQQTHALVHTGPRARAHAHTGVHTGGDHMLLFITFITRKRQEDTSQTQDVFFLLFCERRRPSLRCSSSCHFTGGPARRRSLFELICVYHIFLLIFSFSSSLRLFIISVVNCGNSAPLTPSFHFFFKPVVQASWRV